MNPRFFACCAMLAVASAAQAGTALRFNAAAGYVQNDNVTRAYYGGDIEKDSYLAVEAAASHTLPLNRDSFVSLGASLQTRRYQTFDLLNNQRLRLRSAVHVRSGSGFTAPGFFGGVSYELRRYDSALRSGAALQLELGMHKRLSEALSVRAGLINESVQADSVVFDTDSNRLYADAEWRLADSHAVYVTLIRQQGDIVATTRGSAGIYNASGGLVVNDDAFDALSPNRLAYRLDARSLAWRLGYTLAIDSRQGIDLSWYSYEASAYRDYSGSSISLYYSYAF